MKRLDLTDFFGFPAEITWDPEANAIYLQLSEEPVYRTWGLHGEAINADFTREDKIVGVEIFR